MIKIFGDTYFGSEYNALFNKYRKELVKKHMKSWKQEDIYGTDENKDSIVFWYMAFLIVMYILNDIKKGTTMSMLYTKYSIEELIHCFSCCGVPFKEMLPFGSKSDGIEHLAIENNFIVENKQCYYKPAVTPPLVSGNAIYQLIKNTSRCCNLLITD